MRLAGLRYYRAELLRSGASRGGGSRPPRRRVVECPNRTPAIGTAMAPVSTNFGPQNCGAVPRTSVQDQGAARMIQDYYDFSTGFDFCSRSITDADRDRGHKLARLRRG